jgi:diguanylate cyclase (GGDEF)-like protein/PAS domain S-box-containing protein
MKAVQDKQSKRLIVIISVCTFLLIAAELMISMNVNSSFSELVRQQRENSVSKMAHMAYNSIQPILDEVHKGDMDSAEATEEITGMVRNMTYGDEYGENYIFMSSYDGTMLVQPFEPRKEGSNQWDLQDSYGHYIIQELVRAAQENPDGSFVTYHYYLPKVGRIEEKLSYVIGIPEINAYIGTGMYMESSYKELRQVLRYQMYAFLLTALLILCAVTVYLLFLIRANRNLTREIREREFAESNIRTVFDSIHDAVIIHNSSGNIILANKRAGILYGIPENQITEYTVQELSSMDYNTEKKLDEAELIENTSMIFEWKARRPQDGSLFDAEVALRKSKWSGEDVIVAVVRDIGDRKKHEEEVRHLAYYDYLTSLPNRVYVINELKKELISAADCGTPGAILFIDLDNFKKINDNFGHSFGDKVLIVLAERLKNMAFENILPARIGGDEFVILCTDSDEARTAEIAEALLKEFRQPVTLHENTVNLTCSMGVALYPKDGGTVEDIFKNADMALYTTKYHGKDGYTFYETAMSDEMRHKSELEKNLRQAYYDQEFSLHYQPMLDLRKNRIIGHEALIRWESPRYGMVMPGQIIPLAEEIGFIDIIGDWVIDTAFAFAKRVESLDLCTSCNVSPVQLARKEFVENVLNSFDRHNLNKGSVAIEITESCLIESFDEVIWKLTLLREKGILIYLDDFGTGYSSLNYLKNLPVDYIKIDKSFIAEITNQGMGSRILKTIITLAHEMGIRTVAEGIETEEQLKLVELYGCDMAQGYLISKPKPEEEITKKSAKSSE